MNFKQIAATTVVASLLLTACVSEAVCQNPTDESNSKLPAIGKRAQSDVTHSWTRTNPGGGGAIAMVGATASGTILAASDLSGVYRSTDNGNSWTPLGANQGIPETHISCLGFHPTDGNTFFAGAYTSAYKTTDGGDSFVKVFPGKDKPDDYSYIESIVLAKSDPKIGYITHHPGAGAFGDVYKTADGGDSWQPVAGENLPDDLRLLKLMVHPQDASIVYVLTGNSRWGKSAARLYRSVDGGVMWKQIADGIGGILDMDLHPKDTDVIFVSTFENPDSAAKKNKTGDDDETDAGAFYKSSDGGATFAELNEHTGIISVGIENPDIIRLVDTLWVCDWNSEAGTWETVDGGKNWKHVGFIKNWNKGYTINQYFAFSQSFNGLNKTLVKDMFNSDRFFGSFGQWAWGSFDGGRTVNNISTKEVSEDHYLSTGVENLNGHCIEVSDANSNVVYIGCYDGGFWYSTDHGGSWTRSLPNYNDFPQFVWDLGDDPVDLREAIRDAGSNVHTIVSDPKREGVVWANFNAEQSAGEEKPTGVGSGLFVSREHGENWKLTNKGLPKPAHRLYGLSLDVSSPVDNRTLYVTVMGDVYKSVDDGQSWKIVLKNGGLKFTAVDQQNGNVVYAGGENGLWQSRNGGADWSEVGIPEMRGSHDKMRRDIVPTHHEHDYSLEDSIVLHAWEGVFDIKTDPNVPGRVYVTAFGEGKGLYRSNDAGKTWDKLLTDPDMRGVCIAPANSDIIYATSSMSYHSGGEGNSAGIQFSMDAGLTWQSANDGMAYNYAGMIEIENNDNPNVWVWSPGTGIQFADVPVAVGSSN